jgi:hypothetical protein
MMPPAIVRMVVMGVLRELMRVWDHPHHPSNKERKLAGGTGSQSL